MQSSSEQIILNEIKLNQYHYGCITSSQKFLITTFKKGFFPVKILVVTTALSIVLVYFDSSINWYGIIVATFHTSFNALFFIVTTPRKAIKHEFLVHSHIIIQKLTLQVFQINNRINSKTKVAAWATTMSVLVLCLYFLDADATAMLFIT